MLFEYNYILDLPLHNDISVVINNLFIWRENN